MGCCGIGGFLGKVLDESVNVVVDYVTLRPVFDLLGYDDQDILSTALSDTRLLTDDVIDAQVLMTQIALEHSATGIGILPLLTAKSSTVTTQLNNYISYGKNTFIDGTLECAIYSNVAVYSEYAGVIDSIYGITSHVTNVTHGTPTVLEQFWHYMMSTYTYNPVTSTLVYSGLQYEITSYVGIPTSVEISRKTTVTTTTTKVVTNINPTTDNVETTVVVLTEAFEGVLSTTTTVTNESVPIGTVVNSENIVVEVVYISPVTLTITLPTVDTVMYVVTFYTTNPSIQYVWYYTTGNATIDDRGIAVSNIQMMPVVTIMDNKIMTTKDTKSARYTQSKKMLKFLGLDIDSVSKNISDSPSIGDITDAFVHFAVDCKTVDPVIAEYVYRIFSSMYQSGNVSNETCNMTFIEGSYNYVLSWKGIQEIETTGSFDLVGTYHSEVTTTYGVIGTTTDENGVVVDEYGDVIALNIKYQVDNYRYLTYVVTGLNGLTVIKSGGQAKGTVTDLTSAEFLVPVGVDFVTSLSPLDKLVFLRKALRLQIHAATITHVAWYKTEKFMKLVQIVIIIIAIVLFIATLPAGGAGGEVWLAWAGTLGLGIAASYALKEILASTDNPYLKALYVAVAVVIAVETGQVTGLEGIGFFSANAISMAVTSYTNQMLDQLASEEAQFAKLSDARQTEIDTANSRFNTSITTEFVASINTTPTYKPFIQGPDLQIYKAIGMQYDWDLLKGTKTYATIFEYDAYYKLGVI